MSTSSERQLQFDYPTAKEQARLERIERLLGADKRITTADRVPYFDYDEATEHARKADERVAKEAGKKYGKGISKIPVNLPEPKADAREHYDKAAKERMLKGKKSDPVENLPQGNEKARDADERVAK